MRCQTLCAYLCEACVAIKREKYAYQSGEVKYVSHFRVDVHIKL